MHSWINENGLLLVKTALPVLWGAFAMHASFLNDFECIEYIIII